MLHKDLQIKLPTYYSKAQQRTRNSTFVIGWWLVAYLCGDDYFASGDVPVCLCPFLY